MENQRKTSKKGTKENIKLPDLKPKKDAKGGWGFAILSNVQKASSDTANSVISNIK